MKFIKLLMFILLFGEATGGYSSDTDPCELPTPLDLSSLTTVVPTCLAERRNPSSAAEMMAIDTQFCECAKQNQLLRDNTPTRNSSMSPQPTYRNYVNQLFNSISNNAVLQLMSYPADSQTLQSRIESFAGLSQRREVLRQFPQLNNDPNLGTVIMSVGQTTPDQCVTFKDYSAQRAIPEDNAFFEDISSMTAFNPDDWDIEKLQDRYNSGSADAKMSVEARLKFLSRNSFISSLFYLSGSDTESNSSLLRRQQEFFRIIKNLSKKSGSPCSETPGACKTEALESGAVERFRTEMDQFMNQPDVVEMLSASTDGSYLLLRGEATEMNRPLSEKINDTNTPEEFFNTQILRDPRFRAGCAGATAPASCYEVLAPYCAQFLIMKERSIPPKNFADVYEALEMDEIVHGSLLQNSPGFQAFNNQMCNTQRFDGRGGKRNFFEFKRSICPAVNTDSSCQDDRALMNRFLAEYPGSSQMSGSARSFTEFLRTTTATPKLDIREVESIKPVESSQKYSQNVQKKPGGSLFDGNFKTQTVVVGPPRSPSLQSASEQRRIAPVASDTSVATDRNPSMDRLKSELSDLRTSIQNRNRQIARSEVETPRMNLPERADIPFSDEPQNYFGSRRSQNSIAGNFPQGSQFQGQQSPPLPSREAVVPRKGEGNLGRQFEGASEQPAVKGISERRNPSEGSVARSAPESTSGISARQPVAEVSPRRGGGVSNGGGSSASRSPASVSQPETPTSFDFRPVIPVTVNPLKLEQALSNPQSLANDEAIMEKVNSSSEAVVRLGLRIAGGTEDTVVYAIKEGGTVRFSLENPSDRPITRPVLNANEMNVRIPDQTLFTRIQTNPSSLREYADIVHAASELPGQVVRMNVISASGESLTVYLDKRRSVPTFSLTEPRSR